MFETIPEKIIFIWLHIIFILLIARFTKNSTLYIFEFIMKSGTFWFNLKFNNVCIIIYLLPLWVSK